MGTQTTVETPEESRREVRYSLTGRTAEAAEDLAAVYGRWVALLEKRGDLELQARADVYRTECRRIAALMRERGWDVYLPSKDLGRR